MAERFIEDDLTAILNIIDAAEGRISTGAEINKAFNWMREELVDYQQGGPDIYEDEDDYPPDPENIYDLPGIRQSIEEDRK